jgi:methylated-DNA-protein-cysteine methyltransferase related protein
LEKYFEKVYAIVLQIPKGKVATYGQIAAILGSPRNARIVGWAMNSAPENINIPCHRVVNKAGDLSPEYVFGNKAIQQIMLEQEGITFKSDGKIDMKKHLWDGNIKV